LAVIESTGSSTVRDLSRLLRLSEGVKAITISADATFGKKAPNVMRINGGAANRNVTALAELEALSGGLGPYLFHNSGTTNNLVIRNVATTTITTLTPGEWAIVYRDSSTWYATELSAAAAAALLAAANVWTGNNDFGVDGTGVDVQFFGDTAGRKLVWDFSEDTLRAQDSTKIGWGSGAGTTPDIGALWDGTKLLVSQLTADSAIEWGVDGAGIDQVLYGDTPGAKVTWDQSADKMLFEGAASAQGLRTSSSTAVAITGATALTLADSGGIFSVSQAAAYDIDLPSPTTGPGCVYKFYLTGPAANNVTITVLGAAATFVGFICIDGANVVATGSTLTFASGASLLGDYIEITSISTGLYHVQAFASGAGGITIA
jgi:hypothetical protein